MIKRGTKTIVGAHLGGKSLGQALGRGVNFLVPPGSVLYSTDFSEFPIGNSPASLLALWDADGVGTTGDLVIDNDFPTTPNEGTKFLRESNNTSSPIFQRQHNVGVIDNGEVLALQYPQTLSRSLRTYFRMSQLSLSGANGYLAEIDGGNSLRIRRIDSGSLTTIASVSFNYSLAAYYWVRTNFSNSDIKVKVWAYGGAEPESWNLETTDNNHLSGYVGVGTNDMDSNNNIIADYFAVSDGITIPVPT